MNFRNLSYFLAVTEEMNVTKAAQRLSISQQSLSSHINKMEDELGVQLFIRTPELKLTYAGERVRDMALRAVALEKEIYRETEEIRGNCRGHLRIGISHTCGRAILPDILPDYNRTHPNVELTLMEGNSAELENWLSHDMVDVIIGYAPVTLRGAAFSELLREKLFLVVPRRILKEQFKDKCEEISARCHENLDISLFQEQPFIMLKEGNRVRTISDTYMLRSNFRPRIIMDTENVETSFALAERGMGCTVYPELFLLQLHRHLYTDPDAPVELFPFRAPETEGTLVVAWMPDGSGGKLIRDFVELSKKVLAKSGMSK